MLYVIWAIINIGLYLFFIVICFQATKLIRAKLGLLASLFFVSGLLSFVGRSGNNNQEPNTNTLKHWDLNSKDKIVQNATENITVNLEETLLATYNLGIQYGYQITSNRNIPISAYCSTIGFTSGTTWSPVSVMVDETNDHKFKYQVLGTVEWKLLGATIYYQSKIYTGVATLHKAADKSR